MPAVDDGAIEPPVPDPDVGTPVPESGEVSDVLAPPVPVGPVIGAV